RYNRPPQRLSNGLRGFVRRTQGQIRQEFGQELTTLEPAERANGSHLSHGVLRPCELYEKTEILNLFCPQCVDPRSVKVVGQRDARVFGSEDRRFCRRAIRTRSGNLWPKRSRRAFTLKARHKHRRSRRRALHVRLPEYSSIWVVRSSGYEIATSVMVPS